MYTLIVYLHLFVLWVIGSMLMRDEAPTLMRIIGAVILIGTFTFTSYDAVWSIWSVLQ